MTYADDREALFADLNRKHRAMFCASEWARLLAGLACQSGCHLAAVQRCYRADPAWRAAEDALEDYDWDGETRRFHVEQAWRLTTPTEAQIEAALARMDHLLGPGWLEAGE